RAEHEHLVDHRDARIGHQAAEQAEVLRQLRHVVEHRALPAGARPHRRFGFDGSLLARRGCAFPFPCRRRHQSFSPGPPGSLVSWAVEDALSGVAGGGPDVVGRTSVAVRALSTRSLATVFPVSIALFSTDAARFMKPTVSAI